MNAVLEQNPLIGSRPSQVELWLLTPQQLSDLAPLAPQCLAEADRKQASRPQDEQGLRHWEGRQVALRMVLASYLGVKPASVRLERDGRGKPSLAGSKGDLNFSVSSSSGWWLGAFSDQEVGIDLEVIESGPDMQAVAQAYFNRHELFQMMMLQDEKERLRFFYRCWTRKEAFLKLKGVGLAGLAALRQSENAPSVWLEDLNLQKELSACLALDRPPDWVRRRDWNGPEIKRGILTAQGGACVVASFKSNGGPQGVNMEMETEENERFRAYSISEVGAPEADRLEKQSLLWMHMELPGILETLPKAGCFVDLGCGTGIHAHAVSQTCPDAQVYGFDPDPMAIEQSQLHYGGKPGLRFDCRGLQEGPPPGFPLADVAMLRFVLMHLPDPVRILKAARAWLKPGGVLHIFDADDRHMSFEPAQSWIPDLLDLMQMVQIDRGGDRRLGADLPALLAIAGFESIGLQQHCLDPVATAMAIPKVFLPVVEFYLAEAEQRGLAGPEKILALKENTEKLKLGLLTRASIPLFHAHGQNALMADA